MIKVRIGIDFDNTIVSYDELFHRVVVEQSLVPPMLLKSKVAVRDYLKQQGQERVWTALQGYVYGARMHEATAYPGVADFIMKAQNSDISIVIISHKTKHPVVGPEYDLRKAATTWINNILADVPEDVFFEPTQDDKVIRIGTMCCDYFIDDLPEVLLNPNFPEKCKRVLFDPERAHALKNIDAIMSSWKDISKVFNTI